MTSSSWVPFWFPVLDLTVHRMFSDQPSFSFIFISDFEDFPYVEWFWQPPTGNGILTEDSGVSGLISRADVAALVSNVALFLVGWFFVLLYSNSSLNNPRSSANEFLPIIYVALMSFELLCFRLWKFCSVRTLMGRSWRQLMKTRYEMRHIRCCCTFEDTLLNGLSVCAVSYAYSLTWRGWVFELKYHTKTPGVHCKIVYWKRVAYLPDLNWLLSYIDRGDALETVCTGKFCCNQFRERSIALHSLIL